MKRLSWSLRLLLPVVLLWLVALRPLPSAARVGAVSVNHPARWNLVAGPAGTDLSAATRQRDRVYSAQPRRVLASDDTPEEFGIDALMGHCPTAAELNGVDSRLSVTFATTVTAGTLVCTAADGSADLTLLQERAFQAVLLTQWLQFDAPFPWTTMPLYDWLTQQITGIHFADDVALSGCCAPAHVIDIQTKGLTAIDPVRWRAGTVTLMVLFVHESRHAEGFLHTCGGNDRTLDELGAWSVQYYLDRLILDDAAPNLLPPDDWNYINDAAAGVLRNRFCGA